MSWRMFLLLQINHLGTIVGENGRRLDPNKIAALQNLPTPPTKTALWSFFDIAITTSYQMCNPYVRIWIIFKRRIPISSGLRNVVMHLRKPKIFLCPWVDTLKSSPYYHCFIWWMLLMTVLMHKLPDGSQEAVLLQVPCINQSWKELHPDRERRTVIKFCW